MRWAGQAQSQVVKGCLGEVGGGDFCWRGAAEQRGFGRRAEAQVEVLAIGLAGWAGADGRSPHTSCKLFRCPGRF